MDKQILQDAVKGAKNVAKEALEIMFNELNHGQQKKMLANEKIKNLFDLYGVEY